MEKLTENNIKDYGFSKTPISSSFANYMKTENSFDISLCLESEEFLIEGSWYYGSDFIRIDTVEELKSLYKLVTKKDLIKIL